MCRIIAECTRLGGSSTSTLDAGTSRFCETMKRTPPKLTPEGKAAANRKRQFHRLWKSDCTHDELCDEMSMTPVEVRAFADSLGLGDRPEPEPYLPSPDEIRLQCAVFRSGWSQAEREARLDGRPLGRINKATGRD